MLLNPIQSPAVVESSNRVAIGVHEFHGLFSIASDRQSSEATRWMHAAAERWAKVRETGTESIDTVKHFGHETRSQAKSVKDKLADRIAERNLRRSEHDEERDG